MATLKKNALSSQIPTVNLTPTDKLALIAEFMLNEDEHLRRQAEDRACELQDSPLMMGFLKSVVESIRNSSRCPTPEIAQEVAEVELAAAIARLTVAERVHLAC